MSTLATPATTPSSGARGSTVPALRTERSVSLIRLSVVAVVIVVYVSLLGMRPTSSLAFGVLGLATVYTLWGLFATAGEASFRLRLTTLSVDITLVTLWVQATGGAQSEFWTLYLIVIASVALRFGPVETVGAAAGLAVLHAALIASEVGPDSPDVFYRPAIMAVAAFAMGILSYQRAVSRREGQALQVLADTQTEELGQERAEVARLKRVDMARSEFVAIAAHEFRTPLAAVIGVLGTLKVHGPLLDPETRDELLDGAAAQAERLARLVEDLLTISRIEDGELHLVMERTDARTLISEATRASGTAGRVHVELGRVEPLVCDADAVIRVLTNLLDNARKYSPESAAIVLSVSRDAEGVRFGVRDAGAGVAAADRDAVFERFRRVDGSGKPGAGLGLYISRGLVAAHRGTMGVRDAREGGAEFWFRLPHGRDDEVAPGRRVPPQAVNHVTAAPGSSR